MLTENLLGDKENSVIFDNKIKRTVPGFTTTVRFDVDVRKMIDYVLSHKEYQVKDPQFNTG